MCVRWCECTYLVMRICIFDNVRIRARWIGPLRLAECSQPISWVSVGISRNVCWYFAECFVCISLVFVGFSRCVRCIIADRQQHFRKPFAAVGVRFIAPAYTYTPTKWQTVMCVWWCGNVYLIMWKHVFGNVEMRVRWNGNTYLMTWKHVFDNVEMCVRWCECTYLVMRICIFDNVRIRARWIGPLRLAECSQPISWVSVGISRNVCWYLAVCFVCISWVFATFSQSVSSEMAIRSQP